MMSCLPFLGIVVASILYLRVNVRLLNEIEARHPLVWQERLRSPRRIIIAWLPVSINIFTLKPVTPYFRWLLTGSSKQLEPTAMRLFRQARLLLVVMLILLLLHAVFCC